MKGKVLIAASVHSVLNEGLQQMGYELVDAPEINQQSAYGLIKDCVGVVTSTRLQLDRDLLAAAPHLKWIGRMGSGMEVIDVLYAESKGIKCFSSPEGNCNAVAEHALGMLLSLTKKITWSHQEIKRGIWERDANRGTELEGKTIGIIGFGNTGRAFAKKLQGFDVRIFVYDIKKIEDVLTAVVLCPDLEPIFAEADILSFHVPLKEDTYHYLDTAFIKRMKKPFVLINTSRGPIVDTVALYDGLTNGAIAGACLDVMEDEPLAKMGTQTRMMYDKIACLPQVVLTPHIAGYSFEALFKMSKVLLERIVTAS